MHHDLATCECGNDANLEAIGDILLCCSCRTCPHERTYHGAPCLPTTSENYCSACVQDLFVVKTFYGPILFNTRAFFVVCGYLGLSLYNLVGLNPDAETLIIDYQTYSMPLPRNHRSTIDTPLPHRLGKNASREPWKWLHLYTED